MNYYTLNETMPGVTEATTVASVAVPALPALAGVKRGAVGGKKKGSNNETRRQKPSGRLTLGSCHKTLTSPCGVSGFHAQ